MAKDTMTLVLNGEVTISSFASAVSSFEVLVRALSKELGADKVKWLIHDLQISSAIATVRGESDILEQVENVVNAYESIGHSLQEGKRPDYSEQVVKAAKAVTSVLGNGITSVRFETPDSDITISSRPDGTMALVITKAYGAMEGRIQTLSNRKGLRFNLYDTLQDRAISCYLNEGQEEKMRQIWGKRAIVEGEISREKDTGRPLVIRRITDIKVLPETQHGSYLKARGIAPRLPDSPLPELVIRQLRDA